MKQRKWKEKKEDFYEGVADKLELLNLMKQWVKKWQYIYVKPTKSDNIQEIKTPFQHCR